MKRSWLTNAGEGWVRGAWEATGHESMRPMGVERNAGHESGWDGRTEASWKATVGLGLVLWSLLLVKAYRDRHDPVIARPHALSVLRGGGS